METMSAIKDNMKGFTLIEIVISLLVITIGVVAVIGVLGTSLDSSAKSHDDIEVVAFADLVLNHLHATDAFSTIPTDGNLTITNYAQEPVAVSLNMLEQFDHRVRGRNGNIQPISTFSYLLNITSDPLSPNVKSVTLKVWPGIGTNETARVFYTELYNWSGR